MKFLVYQDGKLSKDFKLAGAYILGVDSIPVRSERKIECSGGTVDFDVKSTETVGLSLMWPSKIFGNILLSTTRLVQRDRPYILNVELARAKLMQITLKREEWALFDENDKIADFAHKAQAFFIEAVKNINSPAKAAAFADLSLQKSLVFSERLAAKYAEHYMTLRVRNKGLGRHTLGCQVEPELMVSENYRRRLFEMFCFVTVPVSWHQLQPEPDRFDFSSIDKTLGFFAGRRLAVCAGPLLCFDEKYLPGWLVGSKPDFERIRESAYKFVSRVVEKYYGRIHAWNLISGINALNFFGFNIEQSLEMTRTACLAAKTADPKSKSRKIVEVLYPWGEYYTGQKDSIPPLVYADMVIQNTIPLDAFGLQIQFGLDQNGRRVRDMMQISSRLDNFGMLSKPIHITGVGIPAARIDAAGGVWHKEWSPDVQAEWIEQFYKIALGKNCVQSVTYSALADSDNCQVPFSGLLSRSLDLKKAFVSMGKLQKIVLKK